MQTTIKRRIFSVFLTMAMAAASVVAGTGGAVGVYADSLTDISGHWAESYIKKAVEYGFVSGYTDKTFKPDSPITRAEFTKMLNGVLGNKGTATISFEDVADDAWYYEDVQKGVAASFITGQSETSFGPDKNITRQETVVMLSRVVPAAGKSAQLDSFMDYSSVESWAQTAFSKIIAKGYISGFEDGSIRPAENLTRAQAAKLLTEVYENENIVSEDREITLPEVTVENTIYSNTLSISESVGDAKTTIENCVILGRLDVKGGGSDDSGAYITSSRVANARIHKSEGLVRVVAEAETTIVNTTAENESYLLEHNLESDTEFGKGFVNVSAARAAYVTLAGDFETVTISQPKVDIILEDGCISVLRADSAATKTNVSIAETASVTTANISANGLVFEGSGNIKELNASADSITYETIPEMVNIASGVTIPPVQEIQEKQTPLLESLSIRHEGSGTDSSYTVLPVSSSGFYYYIPDEATELVLSFRAVSDETAEGYVQDPYYTVKCGTSVQNVEVSNGNAVAEVSVEEGTESKRLTVTVGADSRDYSEKTYTIHLIRISTKISSVCHENRVITDYVCANSAASAANPYTISEASAALAVNLEETQNPDFVCYNVYRMTSDGTETVAEGVSGGNTISLDAGYTYRLVPECLCYSDSYAGCKSVKGQGVYLTIEKE